MTATLLDGKATSAAIRAALTTRVAALAATPGLGTVLVGDDPGSASYVAGKHRDCAESFLAPMPGGVGPMTRAMLVSNVVAAAERAAAPA